MNLSRCYSLSDFVDVICAVNQMVEESSGGELFMLSLRCNAERSDALESAHQLSDGLTLETEKIFMRKLITSLTDARLKT